MTRRHPPGALLAAYMAVANVVFWAAIIEERKSFGLEPTVSHVEVVRWTVFGITILKIEHII